MAGINETDEQFALRLQEIELGVITFIGTNLFFNWLHQKSAFVNEKSYFVC